MAKTDPRVDQYIANAADFAKPILNHIRELVHSSCPDVEETLKWRFPHFLHKGILCSMAAFKNHCAFGFWKASLVLEKNTDESGMGHFGRITSVSDLPKDEILTAYIKKAVRLNDGDVKRPARAKTKEKKELIIPDFFTSALRKNKKALTSFENFSYSHKKEYLDWITEAKREETRDKRLETMVQWLEEGKSRNWKYLNC